MREYTDKILVMLRDGDRELIKRRMQEAGIRNMSAYIRKMAIDGYVIRLDLSDLKEISRLMGINSNNLNQYAKKANETGSIYLQDIQQLKNQQEEIWIAVKDVLARLAAIQ